MGRFKDIYIEYMMTEQEILIDIGELLPPEKNCRTELREEVIPYHLREYSIHRERLKNVMDELKIKSEMKDWMKQTNADKRREIALHLNSTWGKNKM